MFSHFSPTLRLTCVIHIYLQASDHTGKYFGQEQSMLKEDEVDNLRQGKLRRTLCYPFVATPEAGVLIDIMEKFDMLISCPSHFSETEGGEDVEAIEENIQRYLVPCLMKRAPDSVYQIDESIPPTLHFKCVHRDSMYEVGRRLSGSLLAPWAVSPTEFALLQDKEMDSEGSIL